ncbi:MAG: type III pantothenate kinase [Proteobacteria bacterium]|nr:type III pantothenate kinase [Pseudomonadota bacterium]
MLLAIDNGNTNVKFALVDAQGAIVRGWRIATDLRRTPDEYAVWLDQLLRMEGFARSDVSAVMIATVVPRALYNLQVLASKYFGVEALIAGRAPVEWGIALKVDEPRALGADRAVNAIAAQALEAGDKIVISFGTATTFDHIGADGAYLGGSIAPGVNLSLDALYNAAAMLPRIGIEPPASGSVIGRDTVGQMQIGIYWGYVGLIEGLLARMKAEIGRPVKVIATGGLAALFQQHSHLFDRVEPDLTLRGIAQLYHSNFPSA